MKTAFFTGIILFLVAACSPAEQAGYNVGIGTPSQAWHVTLKDGTPAWAYWCVYSETCLRRARAACNNSFVLHRPGDIDKARSAEAVQGGFFRKVQGQQFTYVVSCVQSS